MAPFLRHSRRGLSLIEVLVALSLMAVFAVGIMGAQNAAFRANMMSQRTSACSTLAQSRIEVLESLAWTETSRPADLTDNGVLAGSPSQTATFWTHPAGLDTAPSAVNAGMNTDTAIGKPIYYVTWHIEDQDTPATWAVMYSRCTWYDRKFGRYRSIVVSGVRTRSDL